MRTLTALLSAAILAGGAHAAPFAKGNPQAGKALHDKACISCHVKLFGGDGNAIYTRGDRKISGPQQLAARVAGCNANTGAGWFPEDETDVAAYLNQQFYQFK
ncbi:MAG TPA: cytochrome c [Thiobacillaceae bacterium]